MKSKLNIVVTLSSDSQKLSPAEQIKLIESFCRIKNNSGVSLNDVKLTFELADIPFVENPA